MTRPTCLISNYDYPELVDGLAELGWKVLAGIEVVV